MNSLIAQSLGELPDNDDAPPALLPFSNTRMALLIGNTVRMLPATRLNVPLWAIVSDLTGHGSSYSCRICQELGFDPHQVVRRRTDLKQCPTANPANNSSPL